MPVTTPAGSGGCQSKIGDLGATGTESVLTPFQGNLGVNLHARDLIDSVQVIDALQRASTWIGGNTGGRRYPVVCPNSSDRVSSSMARLHSPNITWCCTATPSSRLMLRLRQTGADSLQAGSTWTVAAMHWPSTLLCRSVQETAAACLEVLGLAIGVLALGMPAPYA